MSSTAAGNGIRAAALEYATRGWPVSPWRIYPDAGDSKGYKKSPIAEHAHRSATCNPDAIAKWWDENPEACVAIAAGPGSGLLILDIDGPEGEASWAKLIAEHGPVMTREARTGRAEGGRHLYFLCSRILKNDVGLALGPGIDVRSDGSGVLAPPSLNPVTGRRYEWIGPHVPIAPAPAWMIAKLTGTAPKVPASVSTDPIREGGRNVALTAFCGAHRHFCGSPEVLEAVALAYNAARFAPPLPEAEVRSVVRSIGAKPGGAGEKEAADATPPEPVLLEEVEEEAAAYALLPKCPTLFDQEMLCGKTFGVGAFTSHGKTTSATAQMRLGAEAGHPQLFVSLEPSKVEIYTKAKPFPPKLIRMIEGVNELDAIKGVITRWGENLGDEGKFGNVIIDYGGAIEVPDAFSREDVVGTSIKALAATAQRLRFALFFFMQLNRESQREDEPQLHHLRDSGRSEQACDVIWLLQKTAEDRIRAFNRKNRLGPLSKPVMFKVDFPHARFERMDDAADWEPLAQAVLEKVRSKGGRMPVREVLSGVYVRGKRPTRRDLDAAAMLVPIFEIEGGDVVDRISRSDVGGAVTL